MKKIKKGRCHTHFKKSIRTKLYEAVGLGKQLKKPLPRGHFRLLRMLYWTIGSKTEFDFIIRLEASRSFAQTLKNDKLQKIINWVESAQDHLQNHLTQPHLAKTTNAIESLHNEIEVYRVFKVGQKTWLGIEFIADSRIYIHNMREFPRISIKLDKEQEYLDRLQKSFGNSSGIMVMKQQLTMFKSKIECYQKELEMYWQENYPKKTLDLFKKLWTPHH